MRRFYIGLHHPSDAWPFLRSMISVNQLRQRKSGFRVNQWILDSGAFTELSTHGRYRQSTAQYAEEIKRWSECGILHAAVTQDYMCEPFILEKTGLTIRDHQRLTIDRYVALRDATSSAYVMPVLQGYTPQDYLEHIDLYGELLGPQAWVGVGSVCKRNGNPDAIEDVLMGIKNVRPDLRLHGFGIKLTALQRPTVRELFYSSDSMAWSLDGRLPKGKGINPNDPREALRYCAEVELLLKQPSFIQPQLFNWWLE